ncbi:MAG: prepilin-type N-terminal cleavage/methylation domain-containing protein [Planctomycetota bacterium]
MPHKSPKHRGFTLIELLVVISIIALLLAILLPVLAAARKSVERSVCASNLRQVTLTWLLYTEDNKGEFPNHNANFPYWIADGNRIDKRPLIEPYTASLDVFYCPSTGFDPDDNLRWRNPSANGNANIDYSIFAGWRRDSAATSTANPSGDVSYVGPEAGYITRIDEAKAEFVMVADRASAISDPLPTTYNHPGTINGDPEGFPGLNVGRYDGSVSWRDSRDSQLQVIRASSWFFY